MSTRYVLDAGVIIALQRMMQLEAVTEMARGMELLVVEEVYDELTDPPSGRYANEARRAKEVLDACVQLVSIPVDSPAATRLDALSQSKRNKKNDRGELASIAWMGDHGDTELVTRDAVAAMRALEELRGRTVGFFTFLRIAVELKALSRVSARGIGEAPAAPGLGLSPPLWWSDWLGSEA